MRRVVGFLAALVVVAAPACVSTNEVDPAGNIRTNDATPTTTAPPPLGGTFGADITYGGVVTTVVSVAAFDQSPTGTPRIKVVMRSENISDSAQENPNLELLCDETTNTGDWYLGSTWEPNVVLPVNAVAQGEVIIGFPLKGTSPEYPVVTCTTPRLRLTVVGSRDDESTEDIKEDVPSQYVFPLDASMIEDAIRRPRGPVLPLPPRGS